MEEMSQAGFSPDQVEELASEQVTALAGPFVARSMVVDQLAEKGIMTPEAGEELGTKLVERVIDYFIEKNG